MNNYPVTFFFLLLAVPPVYGRPSGTVKVTFVHGTYEYGDYAPSDAWDDAFSQLGWEVDKLLTADKHVWKNHLRLRSKNKFQLAVG